jgi:DNA-binding transcriptional regulator LsrR (DeoR family)
MPRLTPPDELRLLVKVCKLYYEDGLTQDEIVIKLQLSRSKVSRLMQRARDEGVVQISVVIPPGTFSDLETRLEARFRLQEVLVIEVHETDSQAVINRQLGMAAAAYLARTIKDNDLVGISWGSTLLGMVSSLQPVVTHGVQVVQIIGGLGQPEAEVHATDLCRRLARTLGARLTLLPAPGIVANQRTKEAFLADNHVQHALDLFPKLDVAMVGIGAPTPDSVVMQDGSIITQPELDDLLKCGAVGDIALHFFDIYGQPVISDIERRLIGITLEQMEQVKRIVGVAGGPDKKAAILGALHGGLVDVLITDSATAVSLLDPVISKIISLGV